MSHAGAKYDMNPIASPAARLICIMFTTSLLSQSFPCCVVAPRKLSNVFAKNDAKTTAPAPAASTCHCAKHARECKRLTALHSDGWRP